MRSGMCGETRRRCPHEWGRPRGPPAWKGNLRYLKHNAARFSRYRTVCIDCGADPRSAADAPLGLLALCLMLISLFQTPVLGDPPGAPPIFCAVFAFWEKTSALKLKHAHQYHLRSQTARLIPSA